MVRTLTLYIPAALFYIRSLVSTRNSGHFMYCDLFSEGYTVRLTQPLGHYYAMRSELVGTPVGPTYLLEHRYTNSQRAVRIGIDYRKHSNSQNIY
jgi:hypothetical protein